MESLYSFSGHNKIPIPLIYNDNYDWHVEVFADYLVIHRSGKLRRGLQTRTTIYFQDVTSIEYYKSLGANVTWIIFSMPGIEQGTASFTTASVTKNISVTSAASAADTIPYDNTYAIINYSDKKETLREHFEIISAIHRDYRQKEMRPAAPAVIQVQDNIYEQLKQLKELLDMGILTNEEYEKKRTQLIEKM